MSTIHYKFKSSLDYQSVTFDGIHISLADLKKAISHQKRLKPGEYNLVITNAQTREVYKNEEDLIPKNTSVIVSRIPVAATSTTNSTSKAWEKFKEDCARAIQQEKEKEMISLEQLNNTADLVNARATEMDKIKAAINQSTRDFDPSNYKSKLPTGTPPNTYTCYKCGKQGHFIHACPLKDSDAPGVIEPRFKRSTGIPNSFLTLTDNPMQPGALLTHTGHFAVPTLDADAYRVGKKERPPFLPQPESEIQQPQQPQIPPALQCPLCKELLRDAVVTPCCGNSFCDECIRNGLLETEDHECPVCHEVEVSPSQLIPNKFHRDAVSKFVNNTSYNQPKSGGAGPAPVTSMMNQHSVAPSLNMPPSSMGQPFRNTLPPGPLHPPSIHPQVQHPPPHRPPQVQHPPPHRPPPQVPTQMTVPPPTQPPPAMPPVEPRPPPQVAALKVESSDPNARRSLSPGERPPTPTRDENSQSATSDDEPRGMAVQVVGTRVGNSIQLTGSDHVPGNDFDHGRQPRGGRGYERRDRERNWDREGRGERKYEGRGDRHMEGRGDRNFERRGDRSYKGRGEGNFERHDRPDHYPKDNYKGSNYEGPPPREPQPNITNPPPLIPPPVKSEPPPFPPFPGPPPQMNIPPPGFGPPPPHVLPPTSGPPPAPIPVVGHSSGGFPPMVYPSGLPPAFPPQVNPYPGRRPLSEAEFYKEKARLLQESLPPPPIAVRPQRDMMDDFHKELLAYSQDQKRRQNIVAKPKSKSRSRSRSKSRPRSRSRSRSRPRSRSKSRVKSRGSRSRSRSKSWVRSRTRSKSRSRGRSRSRNRKLSRSRSHTPRLRSRSRSKSYSRSPRPRLRSRSRTRSLRRSRSRSPRPRSRTRSPWRSRSRSRTPRRRFSRSRSRSRSRPRYRSFSRSRSRSLSRSPRYARSRSRSPYRRRSPFYSRSKSPLRPKSPIKSQNLRRDRWTPPPYRSFRDPPEPPPPPPGEGVPPPLMGLPFRHYSPPPDRYGYLPYQDRGPPPPPDPYYRYDAHPYENPFDDFFRFGRNGPPPHGAPGPGYPYMDGMARDPRSKSPRRRGGRSPGRAGRGRRDRNQDFNRNRNPECRNQDFYNRDQDFERGNRHEDMHKRDDNSQEAKPERRRGEADRRSRDKGKDKEKKKDSKDNKENADVKVKKESSTRKDKETSQKGSVDKDVKRVKKRHGKDGSDSDSNVNAQKITKPGNLIQVKIESIPEETKKSSSSEKGRKKDPLPKKTVKSDSEKPTGKKPIGSKSKEVKKPDRPVASTDKSDHEKPKKARMEKCISNDGNQSDNMPGKLRVKTKKKKTTKLAAAGGAESSGADDKADANVDTSEKRRKLKRTTPDIPEDIPEEDTESPAKRLKMDDEVEGTQVLSKTAATKDEDMLPVPEPSKWEREDYEEDSSSPARKMKRSSDKKPLPKSVIESAEKVLSQKPMRPTSVASAVSAPVQTKPHRRVYLDEEPMATDDDDRRVMNKQKSIEITISQADRARGDGKSKSDRRDSDDRRVDRTTSVSKLRSDDDRKSGRKTSTGSIKDRLGKRGDGASKDLEKPGRERGNQDYSGDNSRFDGSRSKEEEQSDKGGKTVKASRERIRSNRDSRDSRAHSNSRERSEQSAKSKSSQDGSKETKGEKSTRVIDRKESLIDEATFEPDYDEADSDSENASASEDPAKPGNAEESGMESSEDEDEEDSSPSKRRSKDGDDKKHKKNKHKKHKHKHKHKHKKRKHKKHKEGKEKDK